MAAMRAVVAAPSDTMVGLPWPTPLVPLDAGAYTCQPSSGTSRIVTAVPGSAVTSTLACARFGRWEAPAVAAGWTAAAAGAARVVKVRVSGGRQELSRQSCRLTVPRTSPLPPGASGARHVTVPACSSMTSPFQAGMSAASWDCGSASGTKAPASLQAESAASAIRVGFGPPGFWVTE